MGSIRNSQFLKHWWPPIVAISVLLFLIGLSIKWEMYYQEQTLSSVSASSTYEKAVEGRNDLAKTINLGAVAVFLLAVAPVLRRKEADITLDFSNRPLVVTLLCVVIAAATSLFFHLQFLALIIDSLRLVVSNSRISPSEKIPDLFDPAISFRFTLQITFLIYAIVLYVVCLFWAKPWKKPQPVPPTP